MAAQILKFGGREVLVGSLTDDSVAHVSSPFATLVSASCQEEIDEVLATSKRLLDRGCKEFCCVGLEAELLHDLLDQLLEDVGALNVVTTWHEDVADGCEYFLFAAGAQHLSLLALIYRHPDLLDALASAGRSE